jgi:outer membrane cobalamin receptor
MKWHTLKLLIIAASGIFTLLCAKTYQVSGKISDAENGAPLAGVNIMVRGTMLGTSTDADGYYNLTHNISDTLDLCFSHIGYRRELRSVAASTLMLNIHLKKQAIDFEKPVLVTASRNRLESFRNTVSSSVINGEDIEQSAGLSSSELLQRETSVSMAGAAYHAAPSIRGLARHRVIMMVDQEKISSERNVGPPGTYINPEDIQRIEIIRGPYSALYGSSAIGGIVNIVTKEWQQPLYWEHLGGTFQSAYQSNNRSWNQSAALNTQWKGQRIHLKTGWRKGENYRDAKGVEVLDTGYEERYLKTKLSLRLHPDHLLELHWRISEGIDIGKASYSTDIRSRHDPDDHHVYGFRYQWNKIHPTVPALTIQATRHEHRLGVISYKHKREADPDEDKAVQNVKAMNTDDLSLRAELRMLPHPKITVLGGFHGFFQNNIYLDEHKIVRAYHTGLFLKEEYAILLENGLNHSQGIYLQSDMILSKRLTANGGIRYDQIKTADRDDKADPQEQNAGAFSGNVGLSYCINGKINFFVNSGTAFRAPQSKELYVSTMTPGGMNIGNPDLMPERSLNYDFGARVRGSRYQSELTLFHNQIENMIFLEWDSSGPERTGTFRNIGEAALQGVEWENRIQWHDWSASLSISHIQGKNISDGELLSDIPPLQLNSSLKRSFLNEKLNAGISGRYANKEKAPESGSEPADAWLVMDGFISWIIHPSLRTNIAIQNLFNTYYREHYQFDWMRAQGRSLNLSLSLKF